MHTVKFLDSEATNDGLGKSQSFESHEIISLTSVNVNVDISVDVYGANVNELIDNKLKSLDSMLTEITKVRDNFKIKKDAYENKNKLS